MKKFMLAILILSFSYVKAQDSTRVLTASTYTNTIGKVYAVYLDQSTGKIFYETKRHEKVRRVYFRNAIQKSLN